MQYELPPGISLGEARGVERAPDKALRVVSKRAALWVP